MEDKERYLEQIKAELGDIDLHIKAIDLTIFDKDNLRDIRDDIVKARQKIVLNDQTKLLNTDAQAMGENNYGYLG